MIKLCAVIPNDANIPIYTDNASQTSTSEMDIPRLKKQKTLSDEIGTLEKKIDEVYNILNASTQREGNINAKDECAIYGELTASKLRKLDETTRDYVMNQIDNFLFKAKTLRTAQQHNLHFECP